MTHCFLMSLYGFQYSNIYLCTNSLHSYRELNKILSIHCVTDISILLLFLFQKSHDKSGIFNLNEDDELTHYGQSLSEIEKFDEPMISDDEEDDEDHGKISGKKSI